MDQHIELPFNQSHAFIIGINDYQHLTPLKTAVNDAKGLAERLQAQHGYIIHGPYLDASKADLQKLFTETMPALVKKEDRVLFYFAGHGIALDGEEGPNGYIVPKDAKQGDRDSLLPMNLLHDSINALPCQHGMLILDCCFSGAFKWSTGFRDVMFDLPKIIYEERFWRYVKDPAWQVITSSAYDQKAVDVISNQSIGMREEGEGIHSPFAKALFEAIDGAGDVIPADEGDGVITASELYAYLRDAVESKTNEQAIRQSPSMFNLERHDKGEFIFLNPRHRFNLPPTPDRNPFMGLASYDEADSNFFFGRDRVIEALVEKVKTNPLTVVSGASGTGKSSVIKAGLLPKLRKEGWHLHKVIRPGKEPMLELQKEIGDLDQEIIAEQQSLIIVDQYEELITQCLDPDERNDFEEQIAKWIEKYPNLHVILSVRSDFEPQFESENLGKWWQAGRYVVPSFSLEEIREIITKPALQAILFYEPLELVDRLEEDISQAPGALPLLSFTLSELYYAYLSSGRQDRSLSLEDYEEMGGLVGALRTKADEVYLNLDTEHQDTMRKLMLRMVSLEGGELARKRVYSSELFFEEDEENHRIESISQQMINARLLVKGSDTQGKTYLEPAHDALVRAWARLWEWIKAIGEEKLIWQNKLSQAVEDYREQLLHNPAKAKQYLWNNNPRLDILADEVKMGNHTYNKDEKVFILQSATRKKNRRNLLIWSLVGVIAIVSGLGLWANDKRLDAIQARSEAQDSSAVATAQRRIAESRADSLVEEKRISDSAKNAAEIHADSSDSRLKRAEFENTRNLSWVNALNAEVSSTNDYFDYAFSYAWNAFEKQANSRVSQALININTLTHRDLPESKNLDLQLDYKWDDEDFRFSHSGKYFTLDRDGSVDVWQWQPLKFLFNVPAEHEEYRKGYGFSPDEDLFISLDFDAKEHNAWKIPSGEITKVPFSFATTVALIFSFDLHKEEDDAKVLFPVASGKFGLASLHKIQASALDSEFELQALADTNSSWIENIIEVDIDVEKAFFSQNGKHIYFTESVGGTIFYKVSIADDSNVQEFGPHDVSIEYISEVSESNMLTAMNNSGVVYCYDLNTGEMLDSAKTYYGDIMHPNGKQILKGTRPRDGNGYKGKIWNLNLERQFIPVLDLKREIAINWVKLSPKSNYLAYRVGDTSWVKAIDRTKNPIYLSEFGKPGSFSNFHFSHDENYLIELHGTRDRKLNHSLYEAASGKKIFESNEVSFLRFSSDSKFCLSLEKDGKIFQRDLTSGAKGKLFLDVKENFEKFFVSPQGNYMVFIGGEDTRKSVLWSRKNNSLRELRTDYDQISFSKDEKFILAKNYYAGIDIITPENLEFIVLKSGSTTHPISSIGREMEMMTIANNKYLLASSGVFEIKTGIKLEDFGLHSFNERKKPSFVALDPQGRWKLSKTAAGRLQKTPIYTVDWLEGKIHKFKNLDPQR